MQEARDPPVLIMLKQQQEEIAVSEAGVDRWWEDGQRQEMRLEARG